MARGARSYPQQPHESLNATAQDTPKQNQSGALTTTTTQGLFTRPYNLFTRTSTHEPMRQNFKCGVSVYDAKTPGHSPELQQIPRYTHAPKFQIRCISLLRQNSRPYPRTSTHIPIHQTSTFVVSVCNAKGLGHDTEPLLIRQYARIPNLVYPCITPMLQAMPQNFN